MADIDLPENLWYLNYENTSYKYDDYEEDEVSTLSSTFLW